MPDNLAQTPLCTVPASDAAHHRITLDDLLKPADRELLSKVSTERALLTMRSKAIDRANRMYAFASKASTGPKRKLWWRPYGTNTVMLQPDFCHHYLLPESIVCPTEQLPLAIRGVIDRIAEGTFDTKLMTITDRLRQRRRS